MGYPIFIPHPSTPTVPRARLLQPLAHHLELAQNLLLLQKLGGIYPLTDCYSGIDFSKFVISGFRNLFLTLDVGLQSGLYLVFLGL